MNTLYIVAGGSKQRSLRLPAAQLYTGDLFSAAITHARRFATEEAAVHLLSPKFGLVSQGRLIEPYHLTFEDLDATAREELVQSTRGELPRNGPLPLRIVVLAPRETAVELLRAACAGTRFDSVPIRSPLSHLTLVQQTQWLQAATWPVACDVTLPASERLSADENERLGRAVRAAAILWSEVLMNNAPPPEPTVFANALALELLKKWEMVAHASRGEWPEDISFPVDSRDGASPLVAALRAIGLEPRHWWKREGTVHPPQLTMRFSMTQVSASTPNENAVLVP